MKNFRGENTEDSIRYSWTQFYGQCRLNPDSVPVVLSLHKIGDSPSRIDPSLRRTASRTTFITFCLINSSLKT